MLKRIPASEMRVGDTIFHKGGETAIMSLERGESCRGVHVNVVRREARYDKKKKRLNLDRGQMIHSDGCYAPCLPVLVHRAD